MSKTTIKKKPIKKDEKEKFAMFPLMDIGSLGFSLPGMAVRDFIYNLDEIKKKHPNYRIMSIKTEPMEEHLLSVVYIRIEKQ